MNGFTAGSIVMLALLLWFGALAAVMTVFENKWGAAPLGAYIWLVITASTCVAIGLYVGPAQ